MSNIEVAKKLHRQFAHPGKEKLCQLVRKAGPPWSDNKDLIQTINTISDSCEICLKYKKSPPRPAVGLPMATRFLETVAMDLKTHDGKLILHLIDLCT